MGVLSAIFNGSQGFLKAAESAAARSSRIAEFAHEPEAQEKIAEDLVGLQMDVAAAKANLKVARVSDELMRELVDLKLGDRS